MESKERTEQNNEQLITQYHLQHNNVLYEMKPKITYFFFVFVCLFVFFCISSTISFYFSFNHSFILSSIFSGMYIRQA